MYMKKDRDSNNFAGISVDEYIKRSVVSSGARSICQSLIYAICGVVNLENVSSLWFLVMLHRAGGFLQRLKLSMSTNTRYFIKGGMLKMIERLKEQIVENNGIIQCSEDVKRIKSNDTRAFVTTSLKTYKCNYVVIAVPPLESLQIIMDEALSSEKTLMTRKNYHSEETIYFEASYTTPFWSPNYSGSVIATLDSNTNLKMTYDASHEEDKALNILAGFISTTADLNHFQALNESFSTDEAENYLEYHERIENNLVFKPCAFEYHLNPMLEPLKRIYFAASEYAKHYPGTADGAVEAGENVACLVLHHARPQVLDTLQIMEYIPRNIPPRYQPCSEVDWAFGVCLITNISILCTFLKHAYSS